MWTFVLLLLLLLMMVMEDLKRRFPHADFVVADEAIMQSDHANKWPRGTRESPTPFAVPHVSDRRYG